VPWEKVTIKKYYNTKKYKKMDKEAEGKQQSIQKNNHLAIVWTPE